MNRAELVWELLSAQRAPTRPSSPLQRPAIYCPGLEDKPWHDPARFEWISELEASYPIILEELDAAMAGSSGFRQYREPRPGVPYTTLHDAGDWHVLYFYFEGRWFRENCSRCPETARIVEAIPRRGGLACFSALDPGTHIRPHAAPFNITLRCHLGLRGLEGARIRVGDETRTWKNGEALVIDDSFEHEVWVEGNERRAILIVDFYHPDLTEEEVAQLREMWRTPQAKQVLDAWYELVGAPKED